MALGQLILFTFMEFNESWTWKIPSSTYISSCPKSCIFIYTNITHDLQQGMILTQTSIIH